MTAGPRTDRDRDFTGAIAYAAALGATAFLAYAFTAIMGRRLSDGDFATFSALIGVLLALSGPLTALFGGAAMAAAREGSAPRAPWRVWVVAAAVAAAGVALLPMPATGRAVAWFAVAAAAALLTAWNRGVLIGLGRLGTVGATLIFEGLSRLGFALLLVAIGWGVAGASGGLALGIAATVLLTEVLVPRGDAEPAPIRPEVWLSIAGLLFLGVVQFADMVAVRLVPPAGDGPYAAASSIARMALFAQTPAAAYALRRAAVAGPGPAFRRSLLLALGPGLAILAAAELAPGLVLRVTYGARYVEAVGLLRTLALAMFLSGLALVLVHLMMGAGRTVWVWSMAVVGSMGMVGVILVAAVAQEAAWAMLVAQAGVLAVAVLHARRLLQAEAGADGAVLILNWRDTRHPQGGGSEVFVEEVARRLAASGRKVTVFCAEHENAPREEVVDGVRFLRRGSWRTVYLWAGIYHVLGRFGRHEVVLDVQNAVPFFSPMYCGRPVVVLVHHVHREQWGMIFGPRVARAGWWIESWLAPKVYRRASYVTVSEASKADMVWEMGIAPERITVVHNGSLELDGFRPAGKAPVPTVTYLGRLVPHKRVEILLDAAAALRAEMPGLRVNVVGQGPWDEILRQRAEALGIADVVTFHGFVDEATKRRILAESWTLALPSVKEGWGLAVMEAAALGTPSVAFGVGGLRESVVDGRTGLLAEDRAGFTEALRAMLTDGAFRERLGARAAERAATFSWDATTAAVADALRDAVAGPQPVPALQPAAETL